eukprot:457522-Amphidinium_carterae.2
MTSTEWRVIVRHKFITCSPSVAHGHQFVKVCHHQWGSWVRNDESAALSAASLTMPSGSTQGSFMPSVDVHPGHNYEARATTILATILATMWLD